LGEYPSSESPAADRLSFGGPDHTTVLHATNTLNNESSVTETGAK
jgi:hypothetical protein